MSAKVLNIAGLSLNMLGVIILFVFGFPQPTHEEGDVLGVTIPGTKERNEKVRQKKRLYKVMAACALVLIVAGFALQVWGAAISN